MKKSILFVMLLSVVSGISARAQTPKEDRIDEEYHQCLLKDTSYANVSACSFAAYSKWDKEMNKTFNKFIGKLKKDKDKAAMKQSQKAWLAYRDAEFSSYNFMFDRPGNRWSVLRQEGRIEIVRERTLQLRAYLEALDTR